MPKPTVNHTGFLIPNASRVANPRMAEPDQIDFNTIAQALWGVIEGCEVTVTGSTATVNPGIALVNGALVTVGPGTVNLGGGGAQSRFDLIVVNGAGNSLLLGGTPSTDPVYNDPGTNNTVLAAVFVPAGASDLSDNVIDKRKFVARSLLTKIPAASPLIQNVNGTGNHFLANGAGKFSWEGDTHLERISAKKLKVWEDLEVHKTLKVGDALTAKSVAATEQVTGSNLRVGYSLAPTGNEKPGDLLQFPGMLTGVGQLFIWTEGQWSALVTAAGAIPVGTIITSIRIKHSMELLSWEALDGSIWSETNERFEGLFALPELAPFIAGTFPNRTMQLPNFEGRMPMVSYNQPIMTKSERSTNTIRLTTAQMPLHKHNVKTVVGGSAGPTTVTIGAAAGHAHAILPTGGRHDHTTLVEDHIHYGADYNMNSCDFVALVGTGGNKLDALFNDRNHTYTVERVPFTMPAKVKVTVRETGSEHGHTVEVGGGHTHSATVSAASSHAHSITEDAVGSGADIDIAPAFITMMAYIKL